MVVGVMGAGGIAFGFVPAMKVQFRGGARLGPRHRARVTRRQGNADLRAVLPVGPGTARRRRAAGKDPEFGGGSPLRRDLAFSVIRTAAWYTPFAARKRSETDMATPGMVLRAPSGEPAGVHLRSPSVITVPKKLHPRTRSHPSTGMSRTPQPDAPRTPETTPPPRPPAPATILPGRRGVAQSGRAPGSGSGGRRFKSCRPDAARPPRTGSGPKAATASGCFGRIFPRPFPPRNRAVISALTHGSNRVYSGALPETVCPGECPFSCSCFLTFPNRV